MKRVMAVKDQAIERSAKRNDLQQLLILSDKTDTLKKFSTNIIIEGIPLH